MIVKEVILAHGHVNIQATHETTLEITRDPHLSRKGDCIIAVSADRGPADLSPKFRDSLRRDNARLSFVVQAGDIVEEINALGSSQLILTHSADMVVRRSDYICNRTLAINADKAACDLSGRLVAKLKDPMQIVKITLAVKT